MEAWNDGDRVRPIPIDDDVPDGLEPVIDATPRVPNRRTWVPLAVAIGAVVIVVGSVTIFGALRFDDPEPSDPGLFSANPTDDEGSTTTATTLPPRLEDLLPGITDRLTLIAESHDDDSAWTLLWDPSFRVPKAIPLGIEASPTADLTSARFDSSGRHVAVATCGSTACDLYVGSPSEVGTSPDVEAVLGFAWHATEVGRIAWVAPSDDGYDVVVASSNPLSQTVEDVEKAFTLSDPFRIVRWDSDGFVVMFSGDKAVTAALEPDGSIIWTSDAAARTTAASDVVAVYSPEDGWFLLDRTSGEPVESPGTPQELVYVGTSDTSDLIARLATREQGGLFLKVSGGSLRAQRIVTIEEQYTPIGFTADATYFLFLSGEDRVVFVDWNLGAARTVDAPEGYRIIGIDVG
jgi:hypothetical protein